jgi:hypothetical protein
LSEKKPADSKESYKAGAEQKGSPQNFVLFLSLIFSFFPIFSCGPVFLAISPLFQKHLPFDAINTNREPLKIMHRAW